MPGPIERLEPRRVPLHRVGDVGKLESRRALQQKLRNHLPTRFPRYLVMSMSAPKNTSNAHYALSGVGIIASLLNAYVAYAGPGDNPMVDPKYFVYAGIFLAAAFGLGFTLAPEMLMRMKARFPIFDDNHVPIHGSNA